MDDIKYQRLGAEEYYVQELFETVDLTGYLKSTVSANKSVHEQSIYQSGTEASFAEQLEKNEAIKVYAKLPGWSKVPTPLGPYNPDWAVLVDKDGSEQLYFVVETKSGLFDDDICPATRKPPRSSAPPPTSPNSPSTTFRLRTSSKPPSLMKCWRGPAK